MLGSAVTAATLGTSVPAWRAVVYGGMLATLPDLDILLDHGDPVLNMTLVVQVVAAGSLWGSGLPRVWGFGRNARAGWLGNRSVDGVTAGCDCG